MQIQLHFPDGTHEAVYSDHPIVLLGPNGVGKTRFAVDMAQRSKADRISANRYIGLTDLPRQPDQDLKNHTKSALQRQLSQYWDVHNEYTFLMSQILEEDKSKAQTYREHHLAGKPIPDDLFKTRLRTITELWQGLFSGRTLKLDYSPTVTRFDSSQPYPTAQMSEGERTALYLITRIVDSGSNIIVVDEPEIHFHPLLARAFWNSMEAYKKDALFIYVTHDIPFALSRNEPSIYVIRTPGTFDKINKSDIPSDAINTILGAASFSIAATRLIFCEGKLDGPDHRLLKAWYNCPNTAVIPVGGCVHVKQCVDVFNGNHATKNVLALGHIDRDDWPDEYLNAQPSIKPLPVNEIEGVVCYEPIFKALLKYYNATNVDARYAAFLTAAQNSVRGIILNKTALNRAKLVLELREQKMRNSVVPDADPTVMRAAFSACIPTPADAETILDEQMALLASALIADDLFRKFPSKTYQGAFQTQTGVPTAKAFDDVCHVLALSPEILAKEVSKAALRETIISALQPHFFSRTT
jgi:hypothetical protein